MSTLMRAAAAAMYAAAALAAAPAGASSITVSPASWHVTAADHSLRYDIRNSSQVPEVVLFTSGSVAKTAGSCVLQPGSSSITVTASKTRMRLHAGQSRHVIVTVRDPGHAAEHAEAVFTVNSAATGTGHGTGVRANTQIASQITLGTPAPVTCAAAAAHPATGVLARLKAAWLVIVLSLLFIIAAAAVIVTMRRRHIPAHR